MYGREYDGRALSFEPSGGLLHFALVMQDRQTDSYWSIMTGDALAGDLRGTPLVELPVGRKSRWGDWRRDHPDTLVLSVGGREHIENNPYDSYFASDEGFRGSVARDRRLPTKASIFAFQSNGRAYATPHDRFEGGQAFRAGNQSVFLYRPVGASVYRSTVAFAAEPGAFVREPEGWRYVVTGAQFDPQTPGFGPDGPERLDGFDTFWFNWSMTHRRTKILRRERR